VSGEDKLKEYEKKLVEAIRTQTTNISGSGKVRIEGVGDVHVHGSGSVSPDEVKISGSGRIPGGLRTKRIVCAGHVSITGDAEAEEMRFSGSATVHGNIEVKILEASGTLAVGGEVKGSEVEVAGSFRTARGIKLNDVLLAHGRLRVSNDVNVQKFVRLRGSFDVDGRVVTGNFEARLDRVQWLKRLESHVENGIEAVNVDVRKSTDRGINILGIPALRKIFRKGRLYTTDIIAKDRVYLENVTCNNVHGRVVVLGEGCEVRGRVQYSESVSTHPTARLSLAPEKVDAQ
jgi:cytoskeletal protein CcmA (bactofilin family)